MYSFVAQSSASLFSFSEAIIVIVMKNQTFDSNLQLRMSERQNPPRTLFILYCLLADLKRIWAKFLASKSQQNGPF